MIGLHKKTKMVVDKPGPDVEHTCGAAVLDNHSVNLLSSIIMALLTPTIAFHTWGYLS